MSIPPDIMKQLQSIDSRLHDLEWQVKNADQQAIDSINTLQKDISTLESQVKSNPGLQQVYKQLGVAASYLSQCVAPGNEFYVDAEAKTVNAAVAIDSLLPSQPVPLNPIIQGQVQSLQQCMQALQTDLPNYPTGSQLDLNDIKTILGPLIMNIQDDISDGNFPLKTVLAQVNQVNDLVNQIATGNPPVVQPNAPALTSQALQIVNALLPQG